MKTILSVLVLAALGSAAPALAHEHDHSAHSAAEAYAVYKATGSVKSVNRATGKVTIAHEPIAELKWPAMTMQFGVSDRKLLDELAAGRKIEFRFVQRGSDYVVTALY